MNSAGDKTAAEFLDAAERLFARYGYERTRVRAIADESGVALGALHYYWGSKQALFADVFERRLGPVMRERRRRFDECVTRAGEGDVNITDILLAAVEPTMQAAAQDGESGVVFAGLMARALTDPAPEVRQVVGNLLGETTVRYMKLLRECCRHLDDAAFYWRFLAVLGAAQNLYSGRTIFAETMGSGIRDDDIGRGTHELVTFLAAGLMAPAEGSTGSGTGSGR